MDERVRPLNDAQKTGQSVVYVMSRDQRVSDNHALLAAQTYALQHKLPLLVTFILYPHSNYRAYEHFDFMLKGLKEVADRLKTYDIPFISRAGKPVTQIQRIVSEADAQAVFFDFNPLNRPRAVQQKLANLLDCASFVVDTHNIIPVWVASDKEEYAAHTFRKKVHQLLEDWLVEPSKLEAHPYQPKNIPNSLSFDDLKDKVESIPKNGSTIVFRPGESAAKVILNEFIERRLEAYTSERNDPVQDAQSQLSPYLHFGQISALRVALEIIKTVDEPPLLFRQARMPQAAELPSRQDSVDAFLEEIVVRKELADNYCYYNQRYLRIRGARDWAKATLSQHAQDPREFTYSKEEWEQAMTHDEAWNAAQNQMMRSGKMHGYMRMYWAKKLLEWSSSPQEALDSAIYLNDKYSIDGGDPNGYIGILWSIAGVHDRPWTERSVYGKIRYMNANGLKRKFNIQEYIQTWQ